jgi:DNA-binding CsgD family transcriptional regulator
VCRSAEKQSEFQRVSDDLSLTDDIYEAAFLPEMWPRLFDRISERIYAALGSIYIQNADGSFRWIGTEGATRLFSEFQALNPPLEHIRLQKSNELQHQGFYTDLDFNDPSIFEHPTYKDFLHPRNFGWFTETTFNLPTGEKVQIGFERRKDLGPFENAYIEVLNRLRPHLGRAAILSAQLGLERAKGMTDALDAIGIPAAVLRTNGRLSIGNQHFQELIPLVVQDRRDRLFLMDESADALLAETLMRLGSNGPTGRSRSIPVPAQAGRPPLIFHVFPVCGAARDLFSRGLALLIGTPIDRTLVPAAEVLQVLFDLTPAEARVARAVAQGKTVDAIALTNGVSRETVRTQLASVLAKTGMSRQAELVALLAGKALF